MNESLKVQPHHIERGAYLYIGQSSMRQVIENTESTKRQYVLRGRAIALGWRDDQIIVIDNDQGESGESAAWREGFQRLVADVGMAMSESLWALRSRVWRETTPTGTPDGDLRPRRHVDSRRGYGSRACRRGAPATSAPVSGRAKK
jgi:hypothetical protein